MDRTHLLTCTCDAIKDWPRSLVLGGLALKLHNELAKHNYEESVGGEGILPDFDWTKQEQSQLTAAIREGLEATDAWQRYLKDVPEDGRQGISRWSDYPR